MPRDVANGRLRFPVIQKSSYLFTVQHVNTDCIKKSLFVQHKIRLLLRFCFERMYWLRFCIIYVSPHITLENIKDRTIYFSFVGSNGRTLQYIDFTMCNNNINNNHCA